METTRRTATATSISWIPSEAVRGMTRLPFERGVTHYDAAPPDHLDGPKRLGELRDADRFRFANRLSAWVDVEPGGRITAWGQDGGGMIGSTTLGLGSHSASFAAVAYPDLRREPEVGDGWVRFWQTAGGRTGVPAPRRVNRPPFVQVAAPTAWSTIELTIHADGSSAARLAGASPFPRHWLYDHAGDLVQKSGLIEFRQWYRTAFGANTPWGDVDHETPTGALESHLERRLSTDLMAGEVKVRRLAEGRELLRQGEVGDELYLLLDGVVSVAVDGTVLAELGPGAVLGERAGLDGGRRTATVTAVTPCRLATTSAAALPADAIRALAAEHPARGPAAVCDVMRAIFCGVRGSTPSPGPEFLGYGGHTSCVAVAPDDGPPTLILDAGTGIRRVTHLLAGAPFSGVILLTHLHWDHTQGLPFFGAADREDAVVDLVMPAQGDAAEVLRRAMGPPHFPIGPDGLRGTWRFRGLEEGVHQLAGFEVTAREIPHKGGRTFGYRVSDGRSSLAYLPDHGPVALAAGPAGHGPYHDAAQALTHGVDVLVHDAQHTTEEFPRLAAFGHSTIAYAVGLAEEVGAGCLVLFHHAPSRTDASLDAVTAGIDSSVRIIVAREPMELTLPAGTATDPHRRNGAAPLRREDR